MTSEYSSPTPTEQLPPSSHTHDITSPTPAISPGHIISPSDTPLYTSSTDYSSSSSTAFFNPDGAPGQYDPSPVNGGRNLSYDSSASFGHDYSSYGSVPSTSHSMQSFGGGGDDGGSGYWGYDTSEPTVTGDFAFKPSTSHGIGMGQGMEDHSTPIANSHMDDDRTPVAPDHQHHQPIHPSQLPSPHDSAALHASTSKPLLSPFRSFGHQHQPSYTQFPSMPINDPNTFVNPSYYQHIPTHDQPLMPMAYHPSFAPTFSTMGYAQPQPQLHMGYSQPIYAPQPSQPSYGPPRSHNGSPTGSFTSAASVKRSQSINSEVRPPRPKLTKEDKRTIVELHKNNTALRQEDIARRYGVDRSTISKIIIAKHRWTAPDDAPVEPPPRAPKSTAGRFPEVDRMMSEWMDEMIARGADVRDPIAREQAKRFALEVGLDERRFKASAKWLDKFKDRRKAAGKPITNPNQSYSHQPYPTLNQISTSFPSSQSADSASLSRSHSTVTLSSSSSSSQEQYIPSPACIPADRLVYNRPDQPDIKPDITPPAPTMPDSALGLMPSYESKPDLHHPVPLPATAPLPEYGSAPMSGYIDSTPQAQSRARSQSSPHTLNAVATMQTPSSGKHVRPSPLALQRQNSYHGSSPSHRRPLPPSRANSSQGPFRRSRPGSLAASAFGITALDGDGPYSPLQSPTTSVSGSLGGHSRRQSDCLTPFTSSMATMALSPDVDSDGLIHSASTSSVSSMPTPLNVPPHTPITPITPANPSAHGAGVFPTLNPDLGGYSDAQQQQYQHHHQQLQQQQSHYAQVQQAARGPHGHAQQYTSPAGPGTMGHAPLQGYASMPNKHYGGQTGSYPGYSPTGEFGQGYGVKVEGQGFPAHGDQRWS